MPVKDYLSARRASGGTRTGGVSHQQRLEVSISDSEEVHDRQYLVLWVVPSPYSQFHVRARVWVNGWTVFILHRLVHYAGHVYVLTHAAIAGLRD